jgi:hypothetical protein
MELKELQKHILTLATLPETVDPVISCCLNRKPGQPKGRHLLEDRKCGLHLIDFNPRTSSALTKCMFAGLVPCIAGSPAKGKQMRSTALFLACSVLFIVTFLVIPAASQTTSSSQGEMRIPLKVQLFHRPGTR